MYREIKFARAFYKLLFPPAQFFSFPGSYRSFVHTQSPVWDYQFGINTQNLAETFAGRTSAKWIVKRKKIRNGLFELYSIQLETIRERKLLGSIELKKQFTFSLIKSSSNRI